MSSWVYLFSQFTPEALLFESLTIFILVGGYASFWVLRKRRMGSVQQTVPVGVVKTYLNELITDAEQLRIQLFGLLQNAGVALDPAQLAALKAPRRDLEAAFAASTGGAADQTDQPNPPDHHEKVSALEAKMAAQAEAMQALLMEKSRIEKELAQAKAASNLTGAGTSSASDGKAMAEFQAKIANLEGKLAEYSVIEDDLANLKKLQQENAQLKAALAGQGKLGPAVSPAPSPAQAPTFQAPQKTPSLDDIATLPADAAFEGLVDQVEQSLQQPEAPAQKTASPIETVAAEKTDADLVAEFEKMLNS